MFSPLLHGWRSWKTSRGVALFAVLALAVGIGSATAIYSVVHAVLLNPLPYTNPDRYYQVFGAWHPHPDLWTVESYPDSLDYEAHATTLDVYGCSTTGSINVVFNRQPVHVVGTEVSAALMRSFGVSPTMGRWFEDTDHDPGATPGAVLSAGLWKRFGSDPAIIGKSLIVNGAHYIITGLMPGWFHFPIYESQTQLWVPLNPDENQRKHRTAHYLWCVAKLKPGVTQAHAAADLDRTLSRLQRTYPGQAEPDFTILTPILKVAVEDIRPSLLLLLACAAALLVITCANVASILLARSVARARETAVRVALGATAWQLGFQYFSEGVIVSLLGAAAGSVLSFLLVRAVLAIAADEIPRAEQIGFNWHVLLFALALAVGCGLFFSLWPLWQARRTAPNAVLTEGARASVSRRSHRLLTIFVVAQVALAFGLVATGGLIFEQLTDLRRVHPGFDPDHLTVVNVLAPVSKYRTDQARIAYETRLREAVRNVTGVESAGFISLMPLVEWGNNNAMQVEGRPKLDVGHSESIENREVSPEYFQAMKIPLLAGRFFNDADKQADIMPMLINETLANLYWRHKDPVGAFVRLPFAWTGKRFQIIGVVGDVRNQSLAAPTRPEFYLSYRELPPENMAWAVRSPLDPATLNRELKAAVQRVDPEQPVFDVRSMREIIEQSLSRQRLQSLMVIFFAISALLLAILGVYGVVAYAVRQRITEMGTRMAIGAAPRDILRLVLGDGLKMALIGIGIGFIAVFVCAELFLKSYFPIETGVISPLFGSTVLIAAFTLIASWFPAWRATTLSPLVAIHSDVHGASIRQRLSYRVLTERISDLVSHGAASNDPQTQLLGAIAEASRNAESFSEAVAAALADLRVRMNASAVYLFTRAAPDQPFRLTSAAPEAPGNLALAPNALLTARLRNYSSALPISRDDLISLRRWAVEQSPAHLPEIEVLEALEVRLAAPLLSKSGITGLLLLGPPVARTAHSIAERRALRTAAAQLALMLENGLLTERIVEQERLRRELMLAAEVQKRLFPETTPETAAIQLAGVSIPARNVGGDYYDFIDLGNHQIGIALADVAGKGIAAALLMSVVQASLRSLAESNGASLAEITSKLNRLLHRSTAASSYATFFYAQVDETTRRLRYVNAGHNPPFLLRNGSSQHAIEELSQGGIIIGMFAQSQYSEAETELHAGDVLMLFSDGVTEAHNPQEEEFGDDRLKDLLRRAAHLPIDEMAAYVLDGLKTWMADAPQYDDLTFVLMKVA